MYFEHNTLEEVIKHLENYRLETIAKIEAWKSVEIKKKKNGDEFAKLSQAVVNANFGRYYPVEDGLHPYLTVTFKCGFKYGSDSIEAFYYVDTLPEDQRNRETIYKNSWTRATSPMTAEELRQTIVEYIECLEKHKINLEKQIANAPALFTKYRTALKQAEKELEEADKELREHGDIYPTSLYYAIKSTK